MWVQVKRQEFRHPTLTLISMKHPIAAHTPLTLADLVHREEDYGTLSEFITSYISAYLARSLFLSIRILGLGANWITSSMSFDPEDKVRASHYGSLWIQLLR